MAQLISVVYSNNLATIKSRIELTEETPAFLYTSSTHCKNEHFFLVENNSVTRLPSKKMPQIA